VGRAADDCPLAANPDQADRDGDGIGDACDTRDERDADADGVLDFEDNCPLVRNPGQDDFDLDGFGDPCDDDADGDGVPNGTDACPNTPRGVIADPDTGCSLDQLCPCEGPRGQSVSWKNHGQYVSCVAKTLKSFLEKHLLPSATASRRNDEAAKSNCGK